MKPRSTSWSARSRLACARSASDCATSICARALRTLLVLHRTIDHREHLPLVDPVARIDRNRDHAAALADHADGQFAPRGKRAGGGDFAFDGGLTRRNDGHRGKLAVAIGDRNGLGTGHLPDDRSRDQRGYDDAKHDEQPAPPARAVFGLQRIQIARQGLPPLAL